MKQANSLILVLIKCDSRNLTLEKDSKRESQITHKHLDFV